MSVQAMARRIGPCTAALQSWGKQFMSLLGLPIDTTIAEFVVHSFMKGHTAPYAVRQFKRTGQSN